MKYKGYTIKFHSLETINRFQVDGLPGCSGDTDPNGNITDIMNMIKDKIDLFIGREIDPSKFDYTKHVKVASIAGPALKNEWVPKIDREEVARHMFKKDRLHPSDWDSARIELKNDYLSDADDIISLIKLQDPSIISDNINHGIRIKFDRDAIANICVKLDAMPDTGKEHWLRISDKIISYIEELIYG